MSPRRSSNAGRDDMRIGVFAGDTIPTAGGAHTLIESIRNEIRTSSAKHEVVFFFSDHRAPADSDRDGFRYVNFADRSAVSRLAGKICRKLGIKVERNGLNEAAMAEGIDLLWVLGPYEFFLEVPYAYTVWDLGHRIRPCFPELNYTGWTWERRESTYRNMLFKATFVITGNEAGKREILENYPMSADKVKVVPFPVPDFCAAGAIEPRAIPGLAEAFFFYPAQFWAHKNHMVLIEAVRYLRDEKGARIDCYFVGSDQGNKPYIEKKIAEYGLGDSIRILGFVEREELVYLYLKAIAMVFPSLLGPNNLPPLEAAALGCPVLISDLPGHVEEMEGAALLVDATDYRAVGEAMLSLHSDPALRESLIRKGLALADKYVKYSYFREVLKIVDGFAAIRSTWDRGRCP
jgi:glycosyltransferase involved in cell wall biosynthesis